MSLYANGRTTGVVVDAGDGVSHTVPVFEGFTIPHAVMKMQIAGRVLTDYMQKLLLENGHSFTSSAELEIVRDIKETLCYVSQDYEEDTKKNLSSENDKQYTLPDKQVINIKGQVRIQCPELLFKPDLNGFSCKSIQDLAHKSITDSDIDVRKELYANMIMSGGTTMYNGIADRLKKEIQNRAAASMTVKIKADSYRKFSVWKGASTLVSLSTFASSWISDEDYREHGAGIVNRKCT